MFSPPVGCVFKLKNIYISSINKKIKKFQKLLEKKKKFW